MAGTLTALTFATDDGADDVLDAIKDLSTRNLIKLQDAVVVRWPAGKRRPRSSQLHDITTGTALAGAFWGLLMGVLFAVPVLGAAAGAAIGAAGGAWVVAMSDLGIDREFIDEVRGKVTPGTSALFLLTSDAALDAVATRLREYDFDLVATNLSSEDELKLREAFDTD